MPRRSCSGKFESEGTSVVPATPDTAYQLDAKDIAGPLDEQVSEACRFVARNMRVEARKNGGRIDLPQFDLTSAFEAVVNAVAHRDYSIYGSKSGCVSSMIAWFSTRPGVFQI